MIITFSNQKGGVGKTTVCREIGISLSLSDKKVLFVDCDPQGNLSKSLLAQPDSAEFGLYEALNNRELEIEKLSESLFLLKGDIRLSLLEKNLLGEFDAYQRLKELLEREEFSPFDYIFLDTPPSLGILTINALNASDFVILPVSCRLYSMQGSNDLMETISKIRKSLNPDLKLLGVVINSFDRVPVIMREIREEIENAFGSSVFSTVLSKSVKIEEAIAARKGILELGIKDRISDDIKQLTCEIEVRGKELWGG